LFNTSLWNRPKIVAVTGYSIEMLLEPLHRLAAFIRESLNPDRLHSFDIDNLQFVKNFHA
jgi:hypothetical protein